MEGVIRRSALAVVRGWRWWALEEGGVGEEAAVGGRCILEEGVEAVVVVAAAAAGEEPVSGWPVE